MNTPNPQADLEGYRENLRQCLAELIERMDLHAIALAKLVSGTGIENQDKEMAGPEQHTNERKSVGRVSQSTS